MNKNFNNWFCSKAVKRMMLTKLNERFEARRQDSKKARGLPVTRVERDFIEVELGSVTAATKGDK